MKIKLEKTKTILRKVHHNAGKPQWVLRLYIAGQTLKAITAIDNLKSICEKRLKGKYHIELIDLLKNPQLGRADQILAIPTLMRKLPLPVRQVIGDLSDTNRLLLWLGLK